jgi:hypothetical protein
MERMTLTRTDSENGTFEMMAEGCGSVNAEEAE